MSVCSLLVGVAGINVLLKCGTSPPCLPPFPFLLKVLMKKAQYANMILFQKMRVGVYIFMHKTIPNLKYVWRGRGLVLCGVGHDWVAALALQVCWEVVRAVL